MSDEITYYDEGNVRVTNARVMIGGKTYSMANITSVSMEMASSGVASCFGVFLFLLGLIIAFLGFSAEAVGSTVGAIVFGLLVAAGGFFILRSNKPNYAVQIVSSAGETKAPRVRCVPGNPIPFVQIVSSAGETNALKSTDKEYIQGVVNAINDAMVGAKR